MNIKRTLALTGVVSLSVLTAQSARAATLTATSFVPLIDVDRDINRTPGPASVVRASATGQGSSGEGFAAFNGEVGAFAQSEDTIPQFLAFGSGGLNSEYVVEGNSDGTTLPLNFNFNLSGSLSADSELGNNFSQGIASANVGGLLNGGDSASPINGGAQLISRAGVPLSFTQTGVFGSGEAPRVRIQPKIRVEANTIEAFDLNEEDLDELNLELDLEGKQDDLDLPVLAGLIANAVTSQGVDRLNFAPGINVVDVGFDVDYGFDRSFSIPLEVVDRGSVNYFINTSALVLSEASANSDYSSTLSLTSITVPEEFALRSVDGLRVVFDSGFELPVQVESSGNGNADSVNAPQTVPEPSTTFGIFLTLLVGSPLLLKSKRNKTFKIDDVSY